MSGYDDSTQSGEVRGASHGHSSRPTRIYPITLQNKLADTDLRVVRVQLGAVPYYHATPRPRANSRRYVVMNLCTASTFPTDTTDEL